MGLSWLETKSFLQDRACKKKIANDSIGRKVDVWEILHRCEWKDFIIHYYFLVYWNVFIGQCVPLTIRNINWFYRY
jgi:hypothetical protein